MTERTHRQLVDDVWDAIVEIDDATPLWESPVAQIERWFTSDETIQDANVARLRDLAASATTAARDGDDLAPTLLTVADAARALAGHQRVYVERELPHPELGFHSHLFWAINNYPLQTPEHGTRWLDKLDRLPDAVAALEVRLRDAADQGRAQLARHARRAAEKLDDHLATEVAEDPLLRQTPPTALDDADADAWRDEVATRVRDAVRPALARFRNTLTELEPTGPDDDHPGLCHQPDGDEDYLELLRGYTTWDAEPQAVHDVGMAQLQRLDEEFRELGAGVFDTTDPVEIRSRLRDDPSLHHTTAESVVEAATALHRAAETTAPSWFLRTPASPCEIRATEHGSIAFYSSPTKDGSRPGVFFFNTSDPTVWGPNLASTVFHEGIPGHHFQSALAVEDDALHDLHRELFLPAFGEGWALYTERLADEMELFPTDLDRLGMLTNDAMRACRLVVDTGLHALGWTREQAIRFMHDNSPLGLPEITAEVDRYIGMPGQACSYMLGRLEIERLRDASRGRLGADFDLPTFHDTVLSTGMLSLPALALVVERADAARTG